MVFGDVEKNGRIGWKVSMVSSWKLLHFKHNVGCFAVFRYITNKRRTDVAAHKDITKCFIEYFTDEGRCGGLSICPRDGYDRFLDEEKGKFYLPMILIPFFLASLSTAIHCPRREKEQSWGRLENLLSDEDQSGR